MKKSVVIGIIISAVFLYLAVRKIEFTQVVRAFQEADYWWTIPMIAANIFTMYLRAVRWRFLMAGTKLINIQSLFSSVMVGFMANNILPARLGEVVRAYSIAKKESISKSGAFATIMVERVFDSFAILLMLAICLVLMPFPPIITKLGYITFALNLGMFIFLIALNRYPQPIMKVLSKAVGLFPEKIKNFILRILDRFISGLTVFNDSKQFVFMILFTALIWVITAVAGYSIFLAFDLHPPFIIVFVLLVIVAFAIMLPSSPGFIGTYQYGCVLALSLFDISRETAFPFSVVLWSCQYFPITSLGLYYLRKEAISFKDITHESGTN
ncbi:MAG: flippase-like domain-containing protein [candidate division Zixibacteria bacterium]|nr:flippase-like domain-containing protein [candidate division Zixibacteria bacterium]